MITLVLSRSMLGITCLEILWRECLMQSNPTLKKNWESKGDPKEPHTHKKNHYSTSR